MSWRMRRVLLYMLEKNVGGLKKMAHKEPASMLDMFDCGVDYFVRQYQFMEMMQAACVRLHYALGNLEACEVSLDQMETYEKASSELIAHPL